MTPEQMRMARAKLDLSQDQVAEAIGITKKTLSNAENSANKLSSDNFDRLKLFYMSHGLEFTDFNGVRETPSGLRTFKGKSGFQEFYNDLYETVRKGKHTEITLFNGVSAQVLNALGEEFLQMHIKRMNEIKHKFRFRVIVEEGDSSYLGNSYCEYKWCPSDRFKNKTIYTYATKIALIDFEDITTVMLFDQKDFAETLLQSFDLSWDYIATNPPVSE